MSAAEITQDLSEINARLGGRSPHDIAEWGIAAADGRAVVTTNFRPLAAVTLHVVTRVHPRIPVLWIDTGYNTASTYRFAETLQKTLNLNLIVYNPAMTSARRDALFGPVPSVYDDAPHRTFTEQVKLEPFRRALGDLQPKIWFSGLRRVQSEFRGSLDFAGRSPEGVLKISPVFDFTDADMEAYIRDHALPDEKDYFDPTKVLAQRECGLHLDSSGL